MGPDEPLSSTLQQDPVPGEKPADDDEGGEKEEEVTPAKEEEKESLMRYLAPLWHTTSGLVKDAIKLLPSGTNQLPWPSPGQVKDRVVSCIPSLSMPTINACRVQAVEIKQRVVSHPVWTKAVTTMNTTTNYSGAQISSAYHNLLGRLPKAQECQDKAYAIMTRVKGHVVHMPAWVNTPRDRHLALSVVIAFLVPALIFSPGLLRSSGDMGGAWSFLSLWDDGVNFMDNHIIQDLSFRKLIMMFTEVRIHVYEPLSWLLKALVVIACGGHLDPLAMRRATLFLHCINGSLLLLTCRAVLTRLLEVTTSRPPQHRAVLVASLLASVAYSCHPVHAEVIGWPSAQPYALSGTFVLSSILTYLAFMARSNHQLLEWRTSPWYWSSLSLYICSVLSKSAALTTVPAFIIGFEGLHIWYPILKLGQTKSLQELAWSKVPFACAMMVLVVVSVWANGCADHHHTDVIKVDWGARLVKAQTMLWMYLRSFIWPESLRAHYAIPQGSLDLSISSTALLSISATIIISLLSLGYPPLAALWASYLGAFLPTCGVMKHGMVQGGGDRYTYLPYQALAIALAFPIYLSLRKRCTKPPPPKGPGAPTVARSSTSSSSSSSSTTDCPLPDKWWRGVAILIWLTWMCPLCLLAPQSLNKWRNEGTFLTEAIRQDPQDWRMMDIYAEYLLREGRRGEGHALLEKLLMTTPGYANPPKMALHRGRTLYSLGRHDESCEAFYKGLRSFPQDFMLINNAVLCDLRDPNKINQAVPKLREALGLAPHGSREKASIQQNLDEVVKALDMDPTTRSFPALSLLW